MNRKQKLRYTIAIYTIILLIAIVLTMVVFLYPFANTQTSNNWQAFWLNIATNFIGVFFIFLIVNVLFLLDDWELSDRVNTLLNRLSKEKPSANQLFQTKLPDLSPYIHQAKQIDFCGVTLTSTINKHLGHLRQTLADGGHIRILVIDPNSGALAMAASRGEQAEEKSKPYYQKKSESTFHDLHYLHEHTQSQGSTGKLEVRLLSYAPSFGLFGFDLGNPSEQIVVEHYPHHVLGNHANPTLTLDPQDDTIWFEFYKQQFQVIWKNGQLYDFSKSQQKQNLPTEQQSIPANTTLKQTYPDLEPHFGRAKEIILIGNKLTNTLHRHRLVLSHALENGAQVKIVLSQPHDDRPDDTPSSHNLSKQTIKWLQENPANQGALQYIELSKLLDISLFALDYNEPNGRIYVYLNPIFPSYKNNPRFELIKSRDPYWFDYYREQIDIIIENGTVQ